MLGNIAEVEREIAALESKQATLPVIEKLAMLYIVLDHNKGENKQQKYLSKEYSRTDGSSDFKQAAMNISFESLVDILDKHMECIKVLYPKEYDAILQRIKEESFP